MAREFPHLKDTRFPDVGSVDVYQYANEFDYERYDFAQMEVTLCAVPWDMGEAHVGNRTISGIGNVVYFGSKENRDAWFDAIPDGKCHRFTTKFKELHRSNEITVPLPFDVAGRFNYVAVRYHLFANDGSPVEFEQTGGVDWWGWFIREVEFVSPNTTRLHLLNDAWQTFIYDVEISSMILERGHAPMFATDADTYLANPIANCANLLAEDVTVEEAAIVSSTHEHVFNAGTTYAVIMTNANPVTGQWGSMAGEDWRTPSDARWTVQGSPGRCAFAVPAASFNAFLANVDTHAPQFASTILGVCFIGSELLELGSSFTFCETACYMVSAGYKSIEVHDIGKADFGYPEQYADMAKLYTYPYAHIEVTDGAGEVTEIRIENTNGKIELDAAMSLVWPWLQVNAHVSSVGRATRRNISFTNISTRNMPVSGNWHDLLMEWSIPVFGVYQDAYANNEYDTFYDRLQRRVAWTNEYDNQAANADLTIDNADLTIAANTSNAAEANTALGRAATYTQTFNFDSMDSDNATTNATATSQIQAQEQQAAIGAASGAVGAITSLATGNIAGAIGGLVNSASTIASSAVSVGLTSAMAAIQVQNNEWHSEAATDKTLSDTTSQQTVNTTMKNINNTLVEGQAANTAATTLANAARTRSTAENANLNQRRQAGMRPALEFGTWRDGNRVATDPLAVYSSIVTMSDYAIRKIGDEFARYGYTLNAQWPFDGNWNIGKHFTYWKLTDFWVKGLNVPDLYMDKLRFFLFGGVTVWGDPADIGNTSVYDNF